MQNQSDHERPGAIHRSWSLLEPPGLLWTAWCRSSSLLVPALGPEHCFLFVSLSCSVVLICSDACSSLILDFLHSFHFLGMPHFIYVELLFLFLVFITTRVCIVLFPCSPLLLISNMAPAWFPPFVRLGWTASSFKKDGRVRHQIRHPSLSLSQFQGP